ncbi:PhnA domain-containing protein [Bradyrhizobium diazoefficiens]|nr:PhnA domain-containing protein [Bradyrhizobium diazoefficiens]WLA69707.1 PhnA domain-containing protein [Bradyrhizobium diazoefficiens]
MGIAHARLLRRIRRSAGRSAPFMGAFRDATDGHNIACKIDGIGAMNLKSEFVKKA